MDLVGSRGRTKFDCSNEIKPFKCNSCPNFRTHCLTSLRRHIRSGHRQKHFEKKIYKCSGCSLSTFSRYLHLCHILLSECATPDDEENKIPRFVCCRDPYNGTTFTFKDEPKSPPTEVKSEPNVNSSRECEQNQYQTQYESVLLSHRLLHHSKPEEVRWLTCNYCHSKFMQRENFENHITLCHTALSDHSHYTKVIDNYALPCDHSRPKPRAIHKNSYHFKLGNVHWFKCGQCPSKYMQEEGLDKHVRYSHPKPRAIHKNLDHFKPGNVHWFKCGQCPSKYMQEEDLNTHMTNSHPKPRAIDKDLDHFKPKNIHWFKCGQCPSKYMQEEDLNTHITNSHPKPRAIHQDLDHFMPKNIHWFKCGQCPSKYMQEEDLNAHITYAHPKPTAIHKNLDHFKPKKINWFKCGQCPSKYMEEEDLDMHIIYNHSEPGAIEWFQCDQCPYKYKQRENLEIHKICSHTKPENIQLFKCDQCPSEFKYERNLKSHVILSHSQIPHTYGQV